MATSLCLKMRKWSGHDLEPVFQLGMGVVRWRAPSMRLSCRRSRHRSSWRIPRYGPADFSSVPSGVTSGKGSSAVVSNGRMGSAWALSAAASAAAWALRRCSSDSFGEKTCSRWECVCTMGRGVPRDAMAWDRRTRVALYGCLVR